MHFTLEDYIKIENWLQHRTLKDSELKKADPIDGSELISIVQNGDNRAMMLYDFKEVIKNSSSHFFNSTIASNKHCMSLIEAISIVPVNQRKLGFIVTFHNKECNWVIYQFRGSSINQWNSIDCWENIVYESMKEFIIFPDNEDLVRVIDGNRSFIKFNDKDHNPDEFSGKGRVILRKNFIGTSSCSIDDEDHFINVLVQDMIDKENTIYIIQYDFDLNGKRISIPSGCTLLFQGGTLNNGTIYLNNTGIEGITEASDIGTVNITGKFKTGQLMTFNLNDTIELKWWTGEQWKTVCSK